LNILTGDREYLVMVFQFRFENLLELLCIRKMVLGSPRTSWISWCMAWKVPSWSSWIINSRMIQSCLMFMEVNIEKQIETLSCHFFPGSLVYNPLIFHKKEIKKKNNNHRAVLP
jgi:hypothetical protein